MSTVMNDLEAQIIRRLDRVEEELRRTRVEIDELLPMLRRAVAQIESLEYLLVDAPSYRAETNGPALQLVDADHQENEP